MPRARSSIPLLLLMASAVLAASAPRAWAAAIGDAAASRPRIGLALSGGGARGAAHVGVLRVLEENRIPIDFIAGTSMGALVGGMYASGLAPAQLDSVLNDIDWMAAFSDRIPRRDRSFRRKRDDDLYLVKNKPGLRGRRLVFPPGLLDGHEIDLLLKRLTLPVVSVRDFDSLPIPYRAVAADIVTGEAVVLDHGDLAMALRSSMAIPTAFAPREIDGRVLVDGGITDNLPIELVRRMGADVIIAVDITSPAQGREELASVVSIATQLATLASEREKQRQVAGLGPRDVFIRPDLGDITVASFERAPEAVSAGDRAAREVADQLRRYSVPPGEYDAWKSARAARIPAGGPPVVGSLRIVNDSRLGDDVIAIRLDAPIGEPVDLDRLERSLNQVYGLELFESVYFDFQQSPEDDVLTVRARARSWGPNYLQGGVAMFDDFEGPNVNIAVAYSRTAINRRNGEWRTGVQIGQEPAVWTEFHQPLDRGLRTFAHAELSAVDRALNVFDSRGDKLSELGITQHGGALALGREMGTWGELRVGVLREGGRIRVQVGDPTVPATRYDTGEVFGQVFVDRLDDLAFPRHGGSLRVRGSAGLDALGSTVEYQQLLAEGCATGTFGRATALFGGVFGTTRDSDAPFERLFRLGGLGRLSGLQQDELLGQHAVLAHAFLYRRVVDVELLPFYAGLSAEYGNVFPTRSAIRLSDGIAAGSAFLGLDTLLGPLCLGFGIAEQGRDNFYLTLGQPISGPRPGFVVR